MKLKSRRHRRIVDLVKKGVILLIALCFVASIVGVALITVSGSRSR